MDSSWLKLRPEEWVSTRLFQVTIWIEIAHQKEWEELAVDENAGLIDLVAFIARRGFSGLSERSIVGIPWIIAVPPDDFLAERYPDQPFPLLIVPGNIHACGFHPSRIAGFHWSDEPGRKLGAADLRFRTR